MRAECNADGPIKTDDLHHLREGEIFVDSGSGEKFRVRKTALAQQTIGGPHGVGDPNDRSLRRVEADVSIPERMNERIQKVECHEPLEGLTRCLKKEGSFIGMRKCQKELERFNDPWFRQKITDEYIKERSEYRRTGKNAVERKWEEYCKYKKERGDWTDLDEHSK
ncbi:unnamed protein product [Litomosoides sigmodontis]|uniref:COX assembly mitochondrial protein n=1 Tax=Litomosoides sigmodontis TaxID=42156 RepID=A0A3P6UT25_LITSI|nr:unnamed protein product [Litomosoides sigmodontis]